MVGEVANSRAAFDSVERSRVEDSTTGWDDLAKLGDQWDNREDLSSGLGNGAMRSEAEYVANAVAVERKEKEREAVEHEAAERETIERAAEARQARVVRKGLTEHMKDNAGGMSRWQSEVVQPPAEMAVALEKKYDNFFYADTERVEQIEERAQEVLAELLPDLGEEALGQRARVLTNAMMQRMAGEQARMVKFAESRGDEMTTTELDQVFDDGLIDMRRLAEEVYAAKTLEDSTPRDDEEISLDEMIGWRLLAEPPKPGKLNLLLLRQRHPRHANENAGQYIWRLKKYSDQETAASQKLVDRKYALLHPEEAAREQELLAAADETVAEEAPVADVDAMVDADTEVETEGEAEDAEVETDAQMEAEVETETETEAEAKVDRKERVKEVLGKLRQRLTWKNIKAGFVNMMKYGVEDDEEDEEGGEDETKNEVYEQDVQREKEVVELPPIDEMSQQLFDQREYNLRLFEAMPEGELKERMGEVVDTLADAILLLQAQQLAGGQGKHFKEYVLWQAQSDGVIDGKDTAADLAKVKADIEKFEEQVTRSYARLAAEEDGELGPLWNTETYDPNAERNAALAHLQTLRAVERALEEKAASA